MKNRPKINRQPKAVSSEDYFDDCLICQLMKRAEKGGEVLTVTKLEQAFAKQNLINQIKMKKPQSGRKLDE